MWRELKGVWGGVCLVRTVSGSGISENPPCPNFSPPSRVGHVTDHARLFSRHFCKFKSSVNATNAGLLYERLERVH